MPDSGTISDILLLAACVLHEQLLEGSSPWAPYLALMPQQVGVAALWEANSEATRWIKGTEVEKELISIGASPVILSKCYLDTIFPYLKTLTTPYIPPTSPEPFLHAYSLVTSRAFHIDAFHKIALVPLADLFDHQEANHVHFESDDFVCPICGSFAQCVHDDDAADSAHSRRDLQPPVAGEGDDAVDLRSDLPIEEGDIVYNTYGATLSNAKLATEYGFALEANSNDTIEFTLADIESSLSLPVGTKLGDLVAEVQQLQAQWVSIFGPLSSQEDDELVCQEQDRDRRFYLDADAHISPSLWLLLAIAASKNKHSSHNPTAHSLQQALTRQRQRFDSAQAGEEASSDSATSTIASALVQLCSARRARMYKPELDSADILEMAESVFF
ncbi:SET domain containing protein [Pseudohyphozyma bogoriensis]|nr:SET domain containing protein [Pseudohyphozyma bogoriensis]